MTTVITRGAGSAQALGYAARATAANYIEDVFSTYLYTGNGSTQTITNGIDLSTKGGLVWVKCRSSAQDNNIADTARGVNKYLVTNNTDPSYDFGYQTVTAFNTTGFSVGSAGWVNTNNATYASWTFRKQAKFFDVVTYTGNGANRTIAHNLGSVPGCIMVKRTDTTGAWAVYHRSLANTEYMVLNTTAAKATGATYWNSTTPTSSVFSLGTADDVNANGGTYVAYLFAHDAGGFGASGSDNVISCGSVSVTSSSGITNVNLGFEPQWILTKVYNQSGYNWAIYDTMRGWVATTGGNFNARLNPNNTNAETSDQQFQPNATGFQCNNSAVYTGSQTDIIYIAIRRGPMRTPTSGTSVFNPTYLCQYDINGNASSGNGIHGYLGNVSDGYIQLYLSGSSLNGITRTRLAGSNYLITSSTAAETTGATFNFWDNNVASGFVTTNSVNNTISTLNFRRAPGFFDVVCYTGTGSNTTQTHNLGVVPELMIVKRRSAVGAWPVYSSALSNTEYMVLNTTAAKATGATYWNSTTPTASVFSIGTAADVNASAGTYVSYLFASCPGVSKVGSYTGTGTTLQVDCGFTGGARFVLIKRTDSTGDWYVWDSTRGIVAGNDPYILLNSTAAEVTGTDYVDTYSAGFEISSTAPAAINANGGTFIFLAIA